MLALAAHAVGTIPARLLCEPPAVAAEARDDAAEKFAEEEDADDPQERVGACGGAESLGQGFGHGCATLKSDR
jgi:hypothetical protein